MEKVDFSDNNLQEQGTLQVAEMLKENDFITDLVIVLCLYMSHSDSVVIITVHYISRDQSKSINVMTLLSHCRISLTTNS